jgi:hypothetical protein
MDAQERGTVDEALTAKMFFKLEGMANQKSVRRVRSDERDDFIEFQKLHNRQKNAGGGRDSGR